MSRPDLSRPIPSRPVHWIPAVNGYTLRDGFQTVALVAPIRPTARNGGARYLADRLDQPCGGKTFRTLRSAVRWCEAADWYGPVRDRMAGRPMS